MSDGIQVWQIPLQVSLNTVDGYLACLSEDEILRANRFKFPDDRRRFVVARGALRYLLSQHIGKAPAAIEFGYGKYGKPFVKQSFSAQSQPVDASDVLPCEAFQFNLSHSGDLALCGLGWHRKVGVDIEKIRSISRLEMMMERCLSTAEQNRVNAARPEDQSRLFLEYWTCKEAYLKATGLGLIQSMQKVEVEASRLVHVPDDYAEGWQLYSIAVPEGYVAALVVAGMAATTADVQVDISVKVWTHPEFDRSQ